MKRWVTFLTTLMLFTATGVEAYKDQWVLLGERDVDLSLDRDEIQVSSGRGRFRAIRLHVRGEGVEFYDVTVVLGNKSRFDVPIRSYIPEGGDTRVIDLPGNERVIRRVLLWYKKAYHTYRPARVSVWALRD